MLPARFCNPTNVDAIPQMIPFGGVDNNGNRAALSNWNDYAIYAPAELYAAEVDDPSVISDVFTLGEGTSFCKWKFHL
jgi:hypothetical protein